MEYQQLGVVHDLPKVHAAEVYGPLEHALKYDLEQCEEMPSGADATVAISVGSSASTFQALNALRQSGGGARSASNREMLETQHDLARYEGLYVETSSALSVAALPHMVAAGLIDPDSTIVAVLTSSGLKDPQVTADHLPPIPVCSSTLDSALAVLREAYGVEAEESVTAH
jgi:threonine synthase